MKQLGIIGFGSFGQFMAAHLKPHFDITIFDTEDRTEEAGEIGVTAGSLVDVASKDIVVFATPVQFMEAVIKQAAPFLKPTALVLDVASVKVRPVEFMKQYLPESADIVALHPLFGPRSGQEGIAGLSIVVCPVRGQRGPEVIKFLSEIVQLKVLERTPEAHDQQMAYVQGLTHLIGRAMLSLNLPDFDQKTIAYEKLLEIEGLVGTDSWDLFVTIEKENPFAEQAREQFFAALETLKQKLQ